MYSMSCFLLPISFCHELEQILARFWWQHSQDRRGIHWCSWRDLCLTKDLGGLGFRDFTKFNVVLLAKQGWRILQNPTSLVARLLRARYFPEGTFMKARLGTTPSLTWKSIWSARGLLEKGLRWQVGSGGSISIWNDFWLPAQEPKLVSTAETAGLTHVSDLIEPEARVWKEELILSVFNTTDAEDILSIPIANQVTSDRQVWCEEQTGIYTVKSGYKKLIPAVHMRNEDKEVLRKLWKSKCPSKVNIQCWKFIKNFVPTKANLCHKRVTNNVVCARCNLEPEDSIHVIRNCWFAKEVWKGMNFQTTYPIPTPFLHDLPAWLNSLLDHFGTTNYEGILFTIWALWHARNKFVFENITQKPEDVITWVKSYLLELGIISARMQHRQSVDMKPWSPPPPNSVKLNFDASFKTSDRVACLGLVIRDEEGFILGAQCLLLNHVSSNFAAEAWAAKKGIELAIDLRLRNLVIEGDSLTVIKKLRSKGPDSSNISVIMADAKQLLGCLDSYQISFIRRGGNRVAHELARERLSIAVDTTWVEEALDRIEALAAEDRRCAEPP
ncbi:hypothetical protein like AT4G29090 [Hibiscus trionum]|uniref:Reverse transcriptase n=1 Tax=Hibiscus trionum TaxID=183268 RepID=A0A9W7MFP8_HIBTR|nr:hypothetical protein like AT4G29090 [Hibiscus trionum]